MILKARKQPYIRFNRVNLYYETNFVKVDGIPILFICLDDDNNYYFCICNALIKYPRYVISKIPDMKQFYELFNDNEETLLIDIFKSLGDTAYVVELTKKSFYSRRCYTKTIEQLLNDEEIRPDATTFDNETIQEELLLLDIKKNY